MQTSSQIADLFRNGRVAMAFGGHGLIPALAEELSLKWNVATLPRGKERVNLAGGFGYAIPSLAEHKDAAWALVKYLESPRGQAIFAESGILVPARRSVREDNIFLRRQPYDAQVFVEESEYGRANLNNRLALELNRLMEWALLPVWRGETGVDAAINELVPRLERAIAP
jgi:multiple sugar transport system substrate-binding protein